MAIVQAGLSDIPIIRKLSEQIWMEYYPSIISEEQIRYMLELMYSEQALTNQMTTLGHQFLLLIENGAPSGYASFSQHSIEKPHRFRLHKLYVLPILHGKGCGKSLLGTICNEVASKGGKEIELNVNKRNQAIGFYKRMGFIKESEVVVDIGSNFYMDDFILVLSL